MNSSDSLAIGESAQGKALKKAANDQDMFHICCLRHLLVSLGRNIYSYQVGNLVKATSNNEYQELKRLSEERWSSITEPTEKNQINKDAKKIGLVFTDGKIQIFDNARWIEVSMQYRPVFRMPSCTNQLESCHWHLNAKTPRKNLFWSSMSRIVDQILKKVHSFNEHYYHNFRRYKNKVKSIVKNTPQEIMITRIQKYNTDPVTENCECGESALFYAMLNILPCSHLYYRGVAFPKVNPASLKIENVVKGEVFFEYNIQDSIRTNAIPNYYSRAQEYGHSKNLDEITLFVKEKLPFTETPIHFIFG
ncbi:hypothetical protein M9Y10_008905 [Tritrichomonas musculus]|uniref:SWIM-type domain-containing protein n=1 Tax=Tritrichomonas musculus TaxID=1915356 RepID=A0ABR2J069_9EUKA